MLATYESLIVNQGMEDEEDVTHYNLHAIMYYIHKYGPESVTELGLTPEEISHE